MKPSGALALKGYHCASFNEFVQIGTMRNYRTPKTQKPKHPSNARRLDTESLRLSRTPFEYSNTGLATESELP